MSGRDRERRWDGLRKRTAMFSPVESFEAEAGRSIRAGRPRGKLPCPRRGVKRGERTMACWGAAPPGSADAAPSQVAHQGVGGQKHEQQEEIENREPEKVDRFGGTRRPEESLRVVDEEQPERGGRDPVERPRRPQRTQRERGGHEYQRVPEDLAPGLRL